MSATCVECGAAAPHVYRELSKGSIRLTRCAACGSLVDKYVEFEPLLLLLDLLLLRAQAYRHLLFNAIAPLERGVDARLLKLAPLYALLDAYIKWLHLRTYGAASSLDALVWRVGARSAPALEPLAVLQDLQRSLLGRLASSYSAAVFLFTLALSELVMFALGLVLAVRLARALGARFRQPLRLNYVVMAVLLSSFGKALAVLLMVWDYDVAAGAWGIAVFVLTCNVTAVRVLLDCSTLRATALVLAAALFKLAYSAFVALQDGGAVLPVLAPY